MIFVQRVPEPSILSKYIERLRLHLDEPIGPLAHIPPYPPELRKVLTNTLLDQFAGKCAYCESPLGITSSGEIEQFRPKSLYGVSACYDWHNLLLSCAVCNRNKRDRFPLERGQQMRKDRPYQERLILEQPSLLHPCIDQPEDHLRFTLDGLVHGLTSRGSITIATLDLNRQQLVNARRSSAFLNIDHPQPTQELAYVATKLQALRSEQDELFREDTAHALQQQKQFDSERERVATDKEDGIRDFAEFEHYIEYIELRNIGVLDSLHLNLLASEETRNPCFALLGENGVGKSTILRAIASALVGPSYAKRLRLTSSSLLADGASKGSIIVRLTGYPQPVKVELQRGRPLKYSDNGAKTLVLAYGASRLLAKGRHKADAGERHAKIRNLLDPFVPVSDASTWLDQLADNRLADVKNTLEKILNDNMSDNPAHMVQNVDGKLRFSLAGAAPRRVTELSDGYKALIGMAGDIMAVMHRAGFDTMANAMGVVLVDELGNHFHPQLKLRIVTTLRAAFPRVQFIFTTHEPLCLRGMSKDEIAVLRRDADGVYLLTDLPDVATMRVDQLLASEHFGLESTVAPERAAEIRLYHILVRKTGRTEDEQSELERIRASLSGTDYFGGSRRERMLLELLDLHDETPPRKPGANVNCNELSKRTRERLKDIMRAIGPRHALQDATE